MCTSINGSTIYLGDGSKLTIKDDSKIKIKDGSKITIKDDSKVRITEVRKIDPIQIKAVQDIAPIAAHIKEVNHIDPLSIESLYVNEIKNIDPVKIEAFNVTNLPMVNMSLRQLPVLDMNLKKLPPVSIGLNQEFKVPSNYTVRGQLLGIEFFRINLVGNTMIQPQDRFRREQGRSPDKSAPETAAAGNPAIPSICRETKSWHSPSRHDSAHCGPATFSCGAKPHSEESKRSYANLKKQGMTHKRSSSIAQQEEVKRKGSLSFGLPFMSFAIPETESNNHDETDINYLNESSSVSSGG